MPIVKTEEVLAGDPRLEGRRVSVLHVAELVLGGATPETAADQLGLSLAKVHGAMAYYYRHPDEMAEIRAAYEALEEELRDRSDAPTKTA
ncbi:hypothetical protein BRC72_13370 [Halobacteriales archaeon QH_7_66_36]|nr:MAG: hypothetical protein BRC72_13370 [Halobacteriales archaeon QH_7_66_36]